MRNDTKLTHETIRTALSYVDAHDREVWVRMGMAVKTHFGESGFDMWDRWSATADNYNQKDARTVWRSLKEFGGTTIRSLLFEAKNSGWVPDKNIPMDHDSLHRMENNFRYKKMEKERKEKQKQAAAKAMDIFQSCKAGTEHPYMVKKGLGDETVLMDKDGNMVVPMMLSPGELSAVQLIDSEGKKKFQPAGCRASDAYFALGNIMRPNYLWLCEGVATGYTMHKVLRDKMKRENDCVVICFSGSNLKKIAEKFKKEKSDGFNQVKDIFVVADMDMPICPKTKKTVTSGLKTHHVHHDSFKCRICKEEHSWCYTYGVKVARETKLAYIYPMNYGSDINDVFLESQNMPKERQNLFLSEFFEMMEHKTERTLEEGYNMQPLITGKCGNYTVGMIKYHIP